MSGRRTNYSTHESNLSSAHIEDREPLFYTSFKQRSRTTIIKTIQVHGRRQQLVERPPSPTRYRRRDSPPTPPPCLPSPPPALSTSFTMSPNDSPKNKPFVPLPPPIKREEERSKTRSKSPKDAKDKSSKDRSSTKVYPIGHKKSSSADTGYGSGIVSPWSVEERSPLDYPPSPKIKKPSEEDDYDTYEINSSMPRKMKYVTGLPKTDVRYVSRNPGSPIDEEYVKSRAPADPYKDKYRATKQTAKVLQEALAIESDTAKYNLEAALKEEAIRIAQIQALREELNRTRLHKQTAEGRAAEAKRKQAEAERKLEQQRVDAIMNREKEILHRHQELTRKQREEELARKQWQEIESSPSQVARSRTQPAPVIDQQFKPTKKVTIVTPHEQTAVTSTMPVSNVIAPTGDPFFDPILEAQRDEERRQARLKEERRGGTTIKETTRGARKERRRTDYRHP